MQDYKQISTPTSY